MVKCTEFKIGGNNMLKNSLIKTICFASLIFSLTIYKSVCTNAESSVNIEQIKSEIAKDFNIILNSDITKDDVTKENSEVTVNQIFKTNLPDEKLYCFNAKLGMNTAYYGLASGNIYIVDRGHSLGALTVFKNGNVYARYEFAKPGIKAEAFESFVWSNKNGWCDEISYHNWYYFKDGIVQTGWQQVEGKWYLLNSSGILLTGWQQINNKWYYLYSDGSMACNTATPDGYKVDETGAWVQ
jgi:hypothetical protein